MTLPANWSVLSALPWLQYRQLIVAAWNSVTLPPKRPERSKQPSSVVNTLLSSTWIDSRLRASWITECKVSETWLRLDFVTSDCYKQVSLIIINNEWVLPASFNFEPSMLISMSHLGKLKPAISFHPIMSPSLLLSRCKLKLYLQRDLMLNFKLILR